MTLDVDAGRVRVPARRVGLRQEHAAEPRRRARPADVGTVEVHARRTTLMFQEAALFPWLTARGNVELALKLAGVPRRERRPRAAELLELVHLGDFAKQRPARAVGRHAPARRARARARAGRRRPAHGRAVRRARRDDPRPSCTTSSRSSGATTGKTVIFVTHNVREAVRLGDRVVLLASRPGRVAADPRRRRSRARAASTRPRWRRSRRRSPTSSARRCVAMASRPLTSTSSRLCGSRLDASSPRRRPLARRIVARDLAQAARDRDRHPRGGRSSCGRGWKPEYVVPSPFTVFDHLFERPRRHVCGTRW